MKMNRIQRVLDGMKAEGIDQMVISDNHAIFYLTGKWIHPGERLLALYLNVKGNHRMFVNELFPIREDLGVEIVWINDNQDGIEVMSKYMEKDQVTGVDKNLVARFLLRLMELGCGTKFVNGSPVVDRVRMYKDEEEKEFMRISSKVNDEAIGRLMPYISQNLSEAALAQKIKEIYEELGCENVSFEPIIAFGANGADPHHGNSRDCFGKWGDSVIIDVGGILDSYCSDMTRTVFLGEASKKQKEVYEIVLEANLRGIAAAKPGARFCDVDNAARDYITSKGYGQYFTHRTGHSIGIEDHEFGDVSSVNTEVLEPGMCFSVEPGIYLPGEFGVRIEDLVIVTEDGCEVLNSYDKSLTILPVDHS